MSILTNQPLLIAPAAADPISLPAGGLWGNGAWVQFISSAPANLAVAGLVVGGSFSQVYAEVDVGVGAVGAEIAVTTIRLYLANSGADGSHSTYFLPAPVDVIATGARVSLRYRRGTNVPTLTMALLYYSSPAMAQLTGGIASTCVPSAADSVGVAGANSIWGNSAWVQLTSGIAHAVALIGITAGGMNPAVSDNNFEIDLGTGTVGNEVVLSTFRGRLGYVGSQDVGKVPTLSLPAVARLAANTRVAIRWRTDIANGNTWPFTLLYYDGLGGTNLPVPFITPAVTPAGCTPQSTISNGGIGHFGCNTGGEGTVSVYPPGSADGVAPVHADATPGELLTGKVAVDIWVEVDVKSYPSNAITTYRRSLAELGDLDTYFGGRKTSGLIDSGNLEHGMGTEVGTFESASADFNFSDTIDRLFRTLLTSQDLDGNEVRVYAASPTARAAGNAPRLLFRGVIQQTKLNEPMVAALTVVDVLFADGGPFGPQRQWPSLIPADVFTSSPPDSLTKPLPWLYGEKSDEGAIDPVSNKAISKGLCPLTFVGQQTIQRTIVVNTPAVPGTPGATYPYNGQDGTGVLRNAATVTIAGSTWGTVNPYPWFAVAAVYANGMTDAIMYDNTLRFPGQGPSVGPPYDQRVVWDLWPGIPIPLGFLVFMYDQGSPWQPIANPFAPATVRYKFVAPVVTNPAGPPDVPGQSVNADEPWAYSVDWTSLTDGDPWPPVGVSGTPGSSQNQNVSEIWDAYLVAGHPVYKIIQLYGSDLGNGSATATHDRVAIFPDTRSDVLVPGGIAWPFSTTYVPYVSPDGTTYWLTMIFARGPLSDDHKNGIVNMACNMLGREDVGDGTGKPFMTAHDAEQCWLENDIIGYWTSGLLATAGTYPQWVDGTAKVRSARFKARQAITVTKLGGRGLSVGWYADKQDSPVNIVAEWNFSTETKVGVNGFGQLTLDYIDTTIDPTTLPTVDHIASIFGPVTSVYGDQRENIVVGSCDWDPDMSRFRSDTLQFKSTVGYAKFKNRWKQGNVLNSTIISDESQYSWILQQRLARLQVGEIVVEASGPIGFLDTDVDTSGITLSTIEGRGASGYVTAPMKVRRRKFNFATRLVAYSMLDITDVLVALRYPGGIGQLFILDDETASPRQLGSETAVPSTALVLT